MLGEKPIICFRSHSFVHGNAEVQTGVHTFVDTCLEIGAWEEEYFLESGYSEEPRGTQALGRLGGSSWPAPSNKSTGPGGMAHSLTERF